MIKIQFIVFFCARRWSEHVNVHIYDHVTTGKADPKNVMANFETKFSGKKNQKIK